MLKPNVPAWFEIPARDLDRAQAFYQTLLGVALKRERFSEDVDQAIFPAGGQPNAAGALVRWDNVYAPSESGGSIVYLNVDDIRPLLERAPELGGAVLLPLTKLHDNIGVFAHIRDSEGNRVGLFSPH